MANCPNIVEGAATAIKEVEGGVELTITAKDEAATKDIRGKSKRLAGMSKEEVPSVKHDGSHHGGGQLGRCPVARDRTEAFSPGASADPKKPLK